MSDGQGAYLNRVAFVVITMLYILLTAIGYVIVCTVADMNPHCVYTPMDNQYARSKEVNVESGAAALKANPLSVTLFAYMSNVDTPGAE